MKKKFYNITGFNTVKISITGKENIELFYHLSDNPVQHHWQSIHKNTKETIMGLSHGTDKKLLIEKLKNDCKKVGQAFPEKIDQESLNHLHNEFVKNCNGIFTDTWNDINKTIHAIENQLDRAWSHYNSNITFYQNPIPTPDRILTEEDKLWLTTEEKWGYLLLGYETVGKEWIDISINNDNIDDLNIKKTIGSETALVFNVEQPYKYADKINFYRWAKKSNHSIPLNSLNQLSLGKYFLGEIIITEAFTNYHQNISDWYVPNHRCKLEWNVAVLGNNPIVTSIDFFDSDLYFNTLMNHSKNE